MTDEEIKKLRKKSSVLMLSNNWKNRLIAEWIQLYIRTYLLTFEIEKIKKEKMNENKILLMNQLDYMMKYKNILESRCCLMRINLLEEVEKCLKA